MILSGNKNSKLREREMGHGALFCEQRRFNTVSWLSSYTSALMSRVVWGCKAAVSRKSKDSIRFKFKSFLWKFLLNNWNNTRIIVVLVLIKLNWVVVENSIKKGISLFHAKILISSLAFVWLFLSSLNKERTYHIQLHCRNTGEIQRKAMALGDFFFVENAMKRVKFHKPLVLVSP